MPKGLTPKLEALRKEIEGYARGYGLDFFETVFEVLSYDELNMVAAYGGFPNRYPHWRWGMEYEQLSKGYEYGLSKIYELVINNDPCYAYLLESNADVDQKLVMAHVFGHCDFFKNNFYFQHTNRRMIDEMANHATRVRRWIDKIGVEKVEDFIDRTLSLENLIDFHSPYIRRNPDPKRAAEETKSNERVEGFKVDREYMRSFVNPTEFLEGQRKKVEDEKAKAKKFPERPQRDVLLFLLQHAPLEAWEFDILSILREESYYFAPQGQTKIMNEGWACLRGDMRVFTDQGLISMKELVEGDARTVSDGETHRSVYDRHVIRDCEVVIAKTRRGFTLCGSNNHRVLLDDRESWRRLDELKPGDRIAVGSGQNLWPAAPVAISWSPAHRVSLSDVAADVGVSLSTVMRHRAGRNTHEAQAISLALQPYEDVSNLALSMSLSSRVVVTIPKTVDERLAAFLGYLVGDGHVSRVKREVGLTTGDEAQAHAFAQLAHELFGLSASLRWDGNRLRVTLHSEMLSDFLVEALGLTTGPSAREKRIPPQVLRSPEPVVRAFLRAYFDCDGHGGKQGVILSTTSDALATDVQLLLLNYGILSRRRAQPKGCWHVHVAGASAKIFAERIGFGLERKQRSLERYVNERRWLKTESWTDEIVSVEEGREDVYDISVEETHRYCAAGLVNHNSFWHSNIMTQKALKDDEVIDYADRHSGTMGVRPGALNPYKLGIELYRDIEERWNKGRFGKEWDECDDLRTRRAWDTKLGGGREKIFEVRKHYNDVTFIDTFLTVEFAMEQKLFVYGFNEKRNSWEILDREFRKVKNKLLSQLTNFGQPVIEVVDGNYENRSELLLAHKHEGQDLKPDYARETLRNLQSLWRRPVNLLTRVDGRGLLLRHDGQNPSEKKVDL